jgi:hypothetical protein
MSSSKALRNTVVGLATVAGVVVLAIVAANAVDAPPSPTAQRLMARLQAPPPPEPAAASNGYLWLLGLHAPPGVDPLAWGQDHLRQLRTVATLQREEHALDPPDAGALSRPGEALAPRPQSRALRLAQGQLARFDAPPQEVPWCRPEAAPCLPTVAQRQAEFTERHAQSQVFLGRVTQMHAAPVVDEVYRPVAFDAPVPSLAGLSRAQQAVFLAAALQADRGDAAGAAQLLQGDAAFQRRMLAGAHGLVLKMVANTHLARNLLFSHELLRRPGVPREAVARYLAVAGPALTPEERRLTIALEHEALLSLPMFEADAMRRRQTDSLGSLGMRLFYQPQRTINCHVAGFEPAWALDRLPSRDMPRGLADYPRQRAAHAQTPWYGYAINPVGRILCTIGSPNYAAYIGRQHDLEALRRAVALSLSADPGSPDTLAALSRQPAFANPYTGQPFDIDAAGHTLRFRPLTPQAGWAAKMGGVIARGG